MANNASTARTIFHYGAAQYNKLAREVKSQSTTVGFKRKLEDHIKIAQSVSCLQSGV